MDNLGGTEIHFCEMNILADKINRSKISYNRLKWGLAFINIAYVVIVIGLFLMIKFRHRRVRAVRACAARTT